MRRRSRPTNPWMNLAGASLALCLACQGTSTETEVAGAGPAPSRDLDAPDALFERDAPIGLDAPRAGAAARTPEATETGAAGAAPMTGEEAAAVSAGAPAPAVVDAGGVKAALSATAFLAATDAGRRHLVGVDWELPAGQERYLCARITVPEDVYLRGFYPLSPPGTHHTAVVAFEQARGPDGVSLCDASSIAGGQSVGGSGVGTRGGPMPDGVAKQLLAGSQLLLQLHLFNVGQDAQAGRSGAEVETTTKDAVRWLSDGVAVGPLKLDVPPGRSVQRGTCTVDHDYTVYAILPHMHEMGVHMRVSARRAAGAVVLYDGAYDFSDQLIYPLDPVPLATGDTLEVECTYDNTRDRVLHFGESTLDEMCIAGLSRYPAGGESACAY